MPGILGGRVKLLNLALWGLLIARRKIVGKEKVGYPGNFGANSSGRGSGWGLSLIPPHFSVYLSSQIANLAKILLQRPNLIVSKPIL